MRRAARGLAGGFACVVCLALLFSSGRLPWVHRSGLFRAAGTDSDGIGDDAEGLTFDVTAQDLGRVEQPLTCVFPFRNRTSRPLRIAGLKASCSCETPEVEKATYAPTETGQITVRFDPRKQTPGPHGFTVTVDYDDPSIPPKRLRLRARNAVDLSAPADVSLRTTGTKEGSAQFTLIDFREEPLVVASVEMSASYLRLQRVAEPSIYDGGWKFLYLVSVTGTDLPVGVHKAALTFRTNDAAHPLLTVPVTIEKVPRIRAAPGILYLRKSPSDIGWLVGRIYLDDREGLPLEVGRAVCSDKAVRCELPSGRAARQILRVALPVEAKRKQGDELELRLSIVYPVQEEICVKLVCSS